MANSPLTDDDVRLTNYAIGEMDAEESQEFERLLADSPEAQAEVDAIRQLTENLSGEFERELEAVVRQPLAPVEGTVDESAIPLPIKDVAPPAAEDKVVRPRFWATGSIAAGLAAMMMLVVFVHQHQNPGRYQAPNVGKDNAVAETIEVAAADAVEKSEPLLEPFVKSDTTSGATAAGSGGVLLSAPEAQQLESERTQPGKVTEMEADDPDSDDALPADPNASLASDAAPAPGNTAFAGLAAATATADPASAKEKAEDFSARQKRMAVAGGGGGGEGEADSTVPGRDGRVESADESRVTGMAKSGNGAAPAEQASPAEPTTAPAATPVPEPDSPSRGGDKSVGRSDAGMQTREAVPSDPFDSPAPAPAPPAVAKPLVPAPAAAPAPHTSSGLSAVSLGGAAGEAAPAAGAVPLSESTVTPTTAMFGASLSGPDGLDVLDERILELKKALEEEGRAATSGDGERAILRELQEAQEALTRYRRATVRGRSRGTERYAPLIDNVFKDPLDEALSTFSIDVDTASYAQVRRMLMREGQWPHPDQVRIEELVNYFDYDYPAPDLEDVEAGDEAPFAVALEVGATPWNPQHRLVRIGLKSAEIKEERPPANLVFLLDVSGSMKSADKLQLVQKSLRALVPNLGAEDTVTMVAYAGRAGEVLEPTPGDDQDTIMAAIDALSAGGSTNGAGGIALAYQRAREHFVKDGVNRVILATDGDFNVGVSGDDALVRLVEKQAKSGVFLTVLGFGTGNLNDSMMEKITNKGNGNYFYIDRLEEGKKVLVEQMAGTLVTVAKDVKIQVEFNPAKVADYRLIGYANRMLNREDFRDDSVDAGEIGAGHTVTALYEVVPVGVSLELTGGQDLEGLEYQRRLDAAAGQDLEAQRQEELAERGIEMVESNNLLTVYLRYKQPDENESVELKFPLADRGDQRRGRAALERSSDDFRFAAAVAAFGMKLRSSRYIDRKFTLEAVAEIASAALGDDESGRRAEFVRMVEQAAGLEPGVGEDVRRAVRERLEQLR